MSKPRTSTKAKYGFTLHAGQRVVVTADVDAQEIMLNSTRTPRYRGLHLGMIGRLTRWYSSDSAWGFVSRGARFEVGVYALIVEPLPVPPKPRKARRRG